METVQLRLTGLYARRRLSAARVSYTTETLYAILEKIE